jgi:FKBP-type peptidyl-prolyl cis-trans isomerase
MKKQLLLCSTILFASHIYLTDAPKEENSIKKRKKQVEVLRQGDFLNLADYTVAEGGILYKTTQQGSGSLPIKGEELEVHYTGYLLKNTNEVGIKFDSSLDRNETFKFVLGAGRVIAGWDKMLAKMKVNEKRIIILPSKQAYGKMAQGKIPADATLIFEIHLIKIKTER